MDFLIQSCVPQNTCALSKVQLPTCSGREQILGLPGSCKPHSLHSSCITKVTNDSIVSIAEIMAVVCHSSVAASQLYQLVDGISKGNRIHAPGLLEE